MQTVINAALGEHANSAEPTHLDLATAHGLLQEHGYELVDRFGHVHASRNAREWHVCLIADLMSLPPSRFLACLEEAIEQSVEHLFSRLTQEKRANSDRFPW
jgi:hypothetical protein